MEQTFTTLPPNSENIVRVTAARASYWHFPDAGKKGIDFEFDFVWDPGGAEFCADKVDYTVICCERPEIKAQFKNIVDWSGWRILPEWESFWFHAAKNRSQALNPPVPEKTIVDLIVAPTHLERGNGSRPQPLWLRDVALFDKARSLVAPVTQFSAPAHAAA